MSQLELTSEQLTALKENDGFVRGSAYVLISKDKYREMMGAGGEEDLAASLRSVEAAMEDVKAGRTMPLEEAKRRLDEKYGVYD